MASSAGMSAGVPWFEVDPSLIGNAKQRIRRQIIQISDQVSRRRISTMCCRLFCCRKGQPNGITATAAPPATYCPTPVSSKLALGAGCYWGTEKYIRINFQKNFPDAIRHCSVGFMAPKEPAPEYKNPTYQQVCSGKSGHIEVLYIELNEPARHFEELIRFFFTFHDPTTKNRQGNDAGFQYASWIFCDDEAQANIARRVRGELQQAVHLGIISCYAHRTITTQISSPPMPEFTKAQEAHQEYLTKHPGGYCNHRIRFHQWPAIEREPDTRNAEGND